jgi:hypothetical protein
MSTTVSSLFNLDESFSFQGSTWSSGSSGGNNGASGTERHHVITTAAANQLTILRELAQINDDRGARLYDHYDFLSNGARRAG